MTTAATEPTAADIAALEDLLWIMVPPGRKMFAPKLAANGIRVHPELATKRLVRDGPESEGNWAPRHLEPINTDPATLAAVAMGQAPAQQIDIEQVSALAMALMVLPPPMPTAMAPEFYALGARVHPELATTTAAPADRGKMLAVIRIIGQRIPELAGLADELEDAATAAAAGDGSKMAALGQRLSPQILERSDALRAHAASIGPEDSIE